MPKQELVTTTRRGSSTTSKATRSRGWTALTYLAARHPDLRWGHTVLAQPFRNPALVAKMGATLQVDQMRPFVELGVDYFMLDCGGFPA